MVWFFYQSQDFKKKVRDKFLLLRRKKIDASHYNFEDRYNLVPNFINVSHNLICSF